MTRNKPLYNDAFDSMFFVSDSRVAKVLGVQPDIPGYGLAQSHLGAQSENVTAAALDLDQIFSFPSNSHPSIITAKSRLPSSASTDASRTSP